MHRETILLLLLTGAAIVFAVLNATGAFKEKSAANDLERSYILDRDFRAKPILPDGARLPDGSPAPDALSFFRAMQSQFPEPAGTDLDRHFQRVETYFIEQFGASPARRIFDRYRNYLNCEISLSRDKRFEPKSTTPKELLLLLRRAQNFRRDRLGREDADALFGPEVKSREYLLRKSMLLDNPQLYGRDKEALLQKLRQEMWGKQPTPSEQTDTDYDRYQLQLQLYHKDLAEMSESDRKKKIDAFRRACFSEAVIQRLQAADRQIAAEKERMARYRRAEQRIMADGTIEAPEKSIRIRALQDEIFGHEADAFRRRQALYEGK